MYRTETAYTGLEGFSNNAQNTNDSPDVQDGYGLMISELLGGDFPNCSSVSGDISSMHNEMGLPNGEVLPLTDDNWLYIQNLFVVYKPGSFMVYLSPFGGFRLCGLILMYITHLP